LTHNPPALRVLLDGAAAFGRWPQSGHLPGWR
jgi:hypothetical protein